MLNFKVATSVTGYRSAIIFVACVLALAIFMTFASQAVGLGLISTSFTKTLGKTLCLCLIAIAMDVVWGYCGILSLGHFAFFGLGGYMIGMWLMYARTKDIVLTSIANNALPATTQELHDAIGTQIFGVVGGARIPWVWYFADSFTAQLVLVVLVPALPAAVFGWLAIRSRVMGTNGVGKTSLLKAIAGVHPRSGGTITFDGREIGKPRSDELAKAGLAYVPQGREIFPLLTVRENLETGFACLPRNDHLGLIMKPKLLLLDEPTEGIQPNIIQQIGKVIEHLRDQGIIAIVLVEQYFDFAFGLADQFVVLERGAVTLNGAKQEIDRELLLSRVSV